MEKEEKYLRVSTYAREKGISVQYVYKLIKQGKITAEKIDGIWFIIKDEKCS